MPAPLPLPTRSPAAAASSSPAVKLSFGKPHKYGYRVCLYGPGGVGKTTLASTLPGNTVFVDLDGSLGALGLDVSVLDVADWADLRAKLNAPGWDGVDNIVIDTATIAEEMAVAHTLKTVFKDDRGTLAKNVEDYGYGKGYTHVFDTFLALLGDLDRHSRQGRTVVLVCHDCTTTVPNPSGEDYLRYEPRLQSPASGKASVRLRVREWSDHMLFLAFDIDVNKREGKVRGGSTRSLYLSDTAFCMAKSRTASGVLPIDETFNWSTILK